MTRSDRLSIVPRQVQKTAQNKVIKKPVEKFNSVGTTFHSALEGMRKNCEVLSEFWDKHDKLKAPSIGITLERLNERLDSIESDLLGAIRDSKEVRKVLF